MKKIIIHKEDVKKQGAKLQFQIKLPSGAKQVTGIFITAVKTGNPVETEMQTEMNGYAGWLRLRIPEKREVFYADLISYANHKKKIISQLPRLGLGLTDKEDWWFGGTKQEFFNITIPVEDTIIEGYYEDHSLNNGQLYTLKVYLEIEQY